MKMIHTNGPGWRRITKVYDPGEKYTCAISWTKGQGRPTKHSVESRYPNSKFVRVNRHTGWCPYTFVRKSFTHVIVERVQA
jgi:hypothetical protein